MPALFSKTVKRVKNLLQPNGQQQPDTHVEMRIVPRDQHGISRKQISHNALKVMSTLHKAGFEGYLVGGGVRDLLLGGNPKDFDVATDATPEQLRKLFRNARIIGRRFKIVHVRFGREVIEVTTFRGSHQSPEEAGQRGRRPKNQQSARSKEGMLLRDNVYGTLEEDAIRRDFTINALYYTNADFAVYDYTNGLTDIKDRVIRIIGDAETRYREDPVRMLRAIRFAAKLDFTIEAHTAAPIRKLADALGNIPAARLFDESVKLLLSGHSLKIFQLLQEYRLFAQLYPQQAEKLQLSDSAEQSDNSAARLLWHALKNTDQRIRQGKAVTPAFIYAALLWPALKQRQQELQAEGMPEMPALHNAAQDVISRQQQYTSIPKRFSMPMREIWSLQLSLPKRHGERAEKMLSGRRFRAAYDFLLLREEAGEITDNLGQWWTEYQQLSPDQRRAMVDALPKGKAGNRRRRRPPRKKPADPH